MINKCTKSRLGFAGCKQFASTSGSAGFVFLPSHFAPSTPPQTAESSVSHRRFHLIVVLIGWGVFSVELVLHCVLVPSHPLAVTANLPTALSIRFLVSMMQPT